VSKTGRKPGLRRREERGDRRRGGRVQEGERNKWEIDGEGK
jgi:hypothetical protein